MVNVGIGERRCVTLDRVARENGTVAPIALRVNPEVNVDRTATSAPENAATSSASRSRGGVPRPSSRSRSGTSACSASTCTSGRSSRDLEPYREGLVRLLELHQELRSAGARDIRYCDIGGGLAVTVRRGDGDGRPCFANAVLPLVATSGLTLLVEPGRFLVGNGACSFRACWCASAAAAWRYVDHRRGDERPAAPVALQRLPPCGSGEFARGARDRQCRGPGVRERRLRGARARAWPNVEEGDLVAIRSAGRLRGW